MPATTVDAMVLSARNVTLSFGNGPTQVDVLRGIDLAIGPGERVAILGPSGSGKSSLLSCLAGLEPATSGLIRVAGEELADKSEDQLARMRRGRIGIVFQGFHLIPTMTALENVMVPLELLGAASAASRAEQELLAVGLGARLHHYPATLSGGEQQRVALARALVARPTILFADEPTGNLDAETGAEVMDLLFRRLGEAGHGGEADNGGEAGATLVLVTHDPGLARRCSRILTMADGRIVGDRPNGGA